MRVWLIDGDVDVVPTRAWAALNAVLADALAHVPEAPQLLDIDVQQLARPPPVRSGGRWAGVPSEDVSTPATEHLAHRCGCAPNDSRPHAGVPRCCGGARPGSRPRLWAQPPRLVMPGSGAACATLVPLSISCTARHRDSYEKRILIGGALASITGSSFEPGWFFNPSLAGGPFAISRLQVCG